MLVDRAIIFHMRLCSSKSLTLTQWADVATSSSPHISHSEKMVKIAGMDSSVIKDYVHQICDSSK